MAVHLAVPFMIPLRSLEDVPSSHRAISHNSIIIIIILFIIIIIIIILFIDRSVRKLQATGERLLVLDESHKFMNGDTTIDGLNASIVNIARLMRHDRMSRLNRRRPWLLSYSNLSVWPTCIISTPTTGSSIWHRSFPWRRVCGRKSSDFLLVSLSGFRLATSRRR